jgi:hypothetical protein
MRKKGKSMPNYSETTEGFVTKTRTLSIHFFSYKFFWPPQLEGQHGIRDLFQTFHNATSAVDQTVFFSGNPAAFEKNTLVHTVGGTEDGNPETHFVTSSRKYFYMFSPWRASLLYLKDFEQKWAHLTSMVSIAH